MTQLHDLTALEQAAAVRSREVSPTELVAHALRRVEALDAGLGANAAYMDDLVADIAASRDAFVGLAVTEIASFRAELSGPQVG